MFKSIKDRIEYCKAQCMLAAKYAGISISARNRFYFYQRQAIQLNALKDREPVEDMLASMAFLALTDTQTGV